MKKKLKEVKVKYVGPHPKVRVMGLSDFINGKEIMFTVPGKVTIEAVPGKTLKFVTLDFPGGYWLETWRAISGLRTDDGFSIEEIYHEEAVIEETAIGEAKTKEIKAKEAKKNEVK